MKQIVVLILLGLSSCKTVQPCGNKYSFKGYYMKQEGLDNFSFSKEKCSNDSISIYIDNKVAYYKNLKLQIEDNNRFYLKTSNGNRVYYFIR